ncbi:hypothetical protein BD413DRAFT_489227 [Trametes elegans]|nr:hypothetical protein BD413DRAFT_489227 [Trametes elegans]
MLANTPHTHPMPRSNGSSCLPAYRSTHMRRFHPYPTRYRQVRRTLVEGHDIEEDIVWDASVAVEPRAVGPCEEVCDGENSRYDDEPVGGAELEDELEDAPPSVRRGKVATMLCGVLASMRRKYFSLEAFKKFLRTGDRLMKRV